MPAPALVRLLPLPLIAPDRVTALALLIVPWLAPSTIRLSMVMPVPVTSSVPPFSVTAPMPRFASAATLSVPPLTEVVKLAPELVPDSASVPAPDFSRVPVPPIVPVKLVLLLPPASSVFAPSVTVPLPASEPMVSLPVSSSVPVTVTALASAMFDPPTDRVPAEMVVAPV